MQAQIQLSFPIIEENSQNKQSHQQSLGENRITLNESAQEGESNIQQPTFTYCAICCQLKQLSNFHKFCCETHSFCKTCIVQLLTNHLYEYKILKCPDSYCQTQLTESSPYFEHLKVQEQKKILKIRRNIQILRNPLIKICKTQQCDGTLQTVSQKLQCNLCKQSHCFKCYQVLHQGHCDTQVVNKLNKRYHYKKCPNCRVLVQKLKGCSHIVCACGFQFCYKCAENFKNNSMGGHDCKVTSDFFESYRESVQTQDLYTKYINCPRILRKLQSDVEKGLNAKYFHICLTIFFAYPFLSLLSIAFLVLLILLLLSLLTTLYVLASIILPIVELFNMHMLFGIVFSKANLPRPLIPLLLLFLLPLTMVCMFLFMLFKPDVREGLYYAYNLMQWIIRNTAKLVVFFILLPFLMCARKEVQPYN